MALLNGGYCLLTVI